VDALAEIIPKVVNVPKFKELNPKDSFVFLALAVRGIVASTLKDVESKNE
jgi:hypothetical protein